VHSGVLLKGGLSRSQAEERGGLAPGQRAATSRRGRAKVKHSQREGAGHLGRGPKQDRRGGPLGGYRPHRLRSGYQHDQRTGKIGGGGTSWPAPSSPADALIACLGVVGSQGSQSGPGSAQAIARSWQGGALSPSAGHSKARHGAKQQGGVNTVSRGDKAGAGASEMTPHTPAHSLAHPHACPHARPHSHAHVPLGGSDKIGSHS